jgi:DMSO/TMAO reductase YedYZ molybdopterin-dependent catalytic subunit
MPTASMNESTAQPADGSPSLGRRQFLSTSAKTALIAALGAPVPFIDQLAPGVVPVGLAQETIGLRDKRGLRVMSDRPVNAETPVTLLDDDITPTERHFVRNNGIVPERAWSQDLRGWSLQIDGEVKRELNLSMRELKSRFNKVKQTLVIECGGNGRAGYNPPAKGNQWTLGAVGCAEYEGVRLRDVLDAAGVKKSAVYIGYYGEDLHLSRDPNKQPISRGVPIAKALDENTILAWQMNGEPLPAYHGFPLRLICPGWPGSTGGKWLRRIWVRDQVHDGTKMTGAAYRVPRNPVAPGTAVPEEEMEIIHEMPVKSIITRPGTGITTPLAGVVPLRGHAWSGWGDVKAMDVSIDFGATWIAADLNAAPNRYAWQRWHAAVKFPKQGYYEVWARATDLRGHMQPMLVPGWNPKGYLNNAMQRIAVKVI